jgi:hypothetical protein
MWGDVSSGSPVKATALTSILATLSRFLTFVVSVGCRSCLFRIRTGDPDSRLVAGTIGAILSHQALMVVMHSFQWTSVIRGIWNELQFHSMIFVVLLGFFHLYDSFFFFEYVTLHFMLAVVDIHEHLAPKLGPVAQSNLHLFTGAILRSRRLNCAKAALQIAKIPYFVFLAFRYHTAGPFFLGFFHFNTTLLLSYASSLHHRLVWRAFASGIIRLARMCPGPLCAVLTGFVSCCGYGGTLAALLFEAKPDVPGNAQLDGQRRPGGGRSVH